MRCKLILPQDNRDPDSINVFEQRFKNIMGKELTDWMLMCKMLDLDDSIIWTDGEYRLSIRADDPFYKLYKIDK